MADSAGPVLKLLLGPVIMKDEIEYQREVGLLQELTATLALAGLAEDGSRWLMRNDFLRTDGKLAARVTSAGGWLDLRARKLAAPPAGLLQALRSLPRTEDFRDLPTSLK